MDNIEGVENISHVSTTPSKEVEIDRQSLGRECTSRSGKCSPIGMGSIRSPVHARASSQHSSDNLSSGRV